MDPVTTAIMAAIAAGVTGGLTDVGKQALVDAYDALKSLLKKKFGERSKVVNVVQDLEDEPDSSGYKAVLQEQISKTKADEDAELLQAARAVLAQIKEQPGNEQHLQYASGSYIAQATQGSRATVSTNDP